MSAIDLREFPQQEFSCTIRIIAARVLGEIIAEWASLDLGTEEVDFI